MHIDTMSKLYAGAMYDHDMGPTSVAHRGNMSLPYNPDVVDITVMDRMTAEAYRGSGRC